MCVRQYRKKPVEVEAVRLLWITWSDVCEFLGPDIVNRDNPAFDIDETEASDTAGEAGPLFIGLRIPTLEGDMFARHGDYIIKGVNGEFYPCKPDIFHKTYEQVATKVAGTEK